MFLMPDKSSVAWPSIVRPARPDERFTIEGIVSDDSLGAVVSGAWLIDDLSIN